MPLWNGRLTEILLTANRPREASGHWAELLGGEADDGGVLLAGESRIRVCEGPAEALAEAHFEASPELISAAAEPGGTPAAANGVRTVTDPDGWVLRLSEVEAVAPPALDGPILSHLTLDSPNPSRQRDWYSARGFLLSDALGEIFYWLRPNPIHHSVAFSAAEHAAVHHLALELPDRAAFIEAIDRVVAKGGKLEFGPGRHLVGGNLFAYLRDRYGLRWELCSELGRLQPDDPPNLRRAEDRARSVNTFGPPPPRSFIEEPGGPPPAGAQRPD